MLTRIRRDDQDGNDSNTNFFRFENQEVRVILENREPGFCLSDSLKAIKSNTTVTAAIAQIEEGLGKGFVINQPLETNGGIQKIYFVFEAALTYLLSRSRTDEGKKLNRLIHTKILPSIRKTGSYSVNKEAAPDKTSEAAFILDIAAKSAINAGVDPELAEQLRLEGLAKLFPEYGDVLLLQKNAIAASKPMPEMPKTPTQVGQLLAVRLGYVSISAKKVNRKLLELGYQVSVTRFKQSNGKEVHDYYQATEKGKNHSQLQMSAYTQGEGKSTKAQLKWFDSIVLVLANSWENN